jgi:glycosyltransferase involved in cell wall biosynthesis
MRRSGRHPVQELTTLVEIYRVLRRERPDILHSVGLKPVLYGATASWLAGVRITVSALAGMGYIFMSGQFRIRLVRRLLAAWLRLALRRRRSWLIVQNDDDAMMMRQGGVVRADQITLVRGSGIDLDHFSPLPEPPGEPVFAMVSRMLTDKGVREAVLAARVLRRAGIAARVWLVGAPDPDNPTSLSPHQLTTWHQEGCIEWLGNQSDVRAIWERAHVCLLPSYREGLPKALLEAAACGRPMITTDVPGCREVVRDGIEGCLVDPQDWLGLAGAMARLAAQPETRRMMGAAARRRAEDCFGEAQMVEATLALYRRALETAP